MTNLGAKGGARRGAVQRVCMCGRGGWRVVATEGMEGWGDGGDTGREGLEECAGKNEGETMWAVWKRQGFAGKRWFVTRENGTV